MLIGLGPFRFAVPTFTADSLSRSSSSRVASVEVIGAKSPTHLLGTDGRSITLKSTFHPMHLNRAGGLMLTGIHLACEKQTPLTLVSLVGLIYGKYVITAVSEERTSFAPNGVSQVVEANLTLTEYVGSSRGSFSAAGLF
jgi:phage protein U